jgi:hypothetical protein
MANPQEMMEAAKLRMRLQMNPRLRLEVFGALSRVFREYNDPVSDELLSSLLLATPDELIGEAHPAPNAHFRGPQEEVPVVPITGTPPQDTGTPRPGRKPIPRTPTPIPRTPGARVPVPLIPPPSPDPRTPPGVSVPKPRRPIGNPPPVPSSPKPSSRRGK